MHVRPPHVLERFGSDGASKAAPAVEHQTGVVGHVHLLDVPLNHAFPQVNGPLEVTRLVLVALTHVEHHQRLTVVHHAAKVGCFAFSDLSTRSLNDGKEARAVLFGHGRTKGGSLLSVALQP